MNVTPLREEQRKREELDTEGGKQGGEKEEVEPVSSRQLAVVAFRGTDTQRWRERKKKKKKGDENGPRKETVSPVAANSLVQCAGEAPSYVNFSHIRCVNRACPPAMLATFTGGWKGVSGRGGDRKGRWMQGGRKEKRRSDCSAPFSCFIIC